MTGSLEITLDKFTFKVATDCLYSPQGVWVRPEGDRVRIGLTDYLQQRSGDVAFADVIPVGSFIRFEEEVATIETIKVNISLLAPISGTVVEVNPGMSTAPEAINQDPYGAGWLAILEASDWETDRARLLDPQAYFAKMKHAAELEIKN